MHLNKTRSRLRRLLLLVIFCTFIFAPHSQPGHNTSTYISLYSQAEQLYTDDNANETTDSLALLKYQQVIQLLQDERKDDSILFDSYLKSGILLTTQKKDESAIAHFLKAIHLNEHSALLPDALSFLPWLYAGSNYYNSYNTDSALICYNKAEDLLTIHPGLNEAERLYNKKGVLYYEAGDFRKSIIHFSKALSMVDSAKANSGYFVVNYKNNIASAYRKLQEYDKALALYKSLLHFNINRAQVLHNIGVTYLSAGDYVAALNCLKQVDYSNALKYNDVANAYLQLKKYDSAEQNIHLAFKVHNTSPQSKPDYANTLRLYGDLLVKRNKPAAAVSQYQQAIIQTYPPFKDTPVTSNPTSFSGLYPFFFLFDVLTAKAHAFEMMNTNASINIPVLKNAFATYHSAITLANYMERIYGSDEAKLFLKKNAEQVYKDAVENALKLFELTKDTAFLYQAFQYIENNKASVLQANIYDLELSTLKGMPVALLQKEKKLKATIAALNLQAEQTQDSAAIAALQIQSQETAIQLSQLQQQLDADPAYHQLKTGAKSLNLDELRDKISKNDEQVLSFYNTGKRQLCFYLDKKQFGYVELPVNDSMSTAIKQLRAMLALPDGGDNKSIQALAKQLYSQLILPVASTIKLAKHLIIIPYNETSYIPFELLQSPESGRLLLQDYSVSYQYAANFINDKQQPVSSYKVLAMAPFTQSQNTSSQLPQLNSSLAEVESLPGTILSGEQASKNAFIQLSPQYPVIHLATHAKVNDSLPEKSFIGFYDRQSKDDAVTRLYEQEIYHLDLTNARLAILSACETGDGKLVNSEGVISLSRAFSYAGCKTVITSMWKANDIATAFITKRLHHYLQRGLAIDEALQKAKLDYLNSDDIEARFKKPAYWANLVVCGDIHTVTKGKRNWWLMGGFIAVLGLFVFYIKKKKAVYTQ